MNTFLHSVFLSLLDLHNLNKMGLERQLSSWKNSLFGGKPHLCSSTESDALFLLMGHKIIQAGKHIHKSKINLENFSNINWVQSYRELPCKCIIEYKCLGTKDTSPAGSPLSSRKWNSTSTINSCVWGFYLYIREFCNEINSISFSLFCF